MFGCRASHAHALLVTPLLGLGLAGCGGSTRTPVILNTERVERAIEQSVLAERHIRANASCPSGVVQRKGLSFPCAVVYRGGSGTFVVDQVDAAGNVHYQAR